MRGNLGSLSYEKEATLAGAPLCTIGLTLTQTGLLRYPPGTTCTLLVNTRTVPAR